MSDWYWVGLAYTIVAGTLAGYAVVLGRRSARARKGVEHR